MSEMNQCPNCRQMVAADSGYCIFCGTRMPAVTASVFPEVSHGSGRIMRCRNGHEFEDDSLSYCPVCGLPFGDPEPSSPVFSGETWKCSCGRENPAENLYCEECGRTKDPGPSGRKETAPPRNDVPIPEGMYIPTPDDLRPKRGSRV